MDIYCIVLSLHSVFKSHTAHFHIFNEATKSSVVVVKEGVTCGTSTQMQKCLAQFPQKQSISALTFFKKEDLCGVHML